MPNPMPDAIRGQKYMSLTTFRKTGAGVATPVWFGEEQEKVYVMTRPDSGKVKRIRNNSKVRVAPCTVRGKVTGPQLEATASILPSGTESSRGREAVRRKYWLARIPFLWRRNNVYLEIQF